MDTTDPVTAAALAVAGPDGAAWVVALGAAVPPELELRPREPR